MLTTTVPVDVVHHYQHCDRHRTLASSTLVQSNTLHIEAINNMTLLTYIHSLKATLTIKHIRAPMRIVLVCHTIKLSNPFKYLLISTPR